MTPAISVLLPVFRPQPHFLKVAIDSILRQTFDSFELLIIEARSETTIEPLLGSFNDPRLIHCVFPGTPHLVDQLNYGLQQARAELIARMDGDDWSYPERFQQQFDYLSSQTNVVVVGTQIAIMDAQDRPLGLRQYPTTAEQLKSALRRSNPLAHPSVMYRKEPVLKAGGYCYRDYPANEDYELWCRLSQQGCQLANLDQTLLRYRIHAGAMKSEKLKAILRGTRLVKRHYFADTMTMTDRARYVAEGLLLNLPGSVILKLFQRMQYQQEPKG